MPTSLKEFYGQYSPLDTAISFVIFVDASRNKKTNREQFATKNDDVDPVTVRIVNDLGIICDVIKASTTHDLSTNLHTVVKNAGIIYEDTLIINDIQFDWSKVSHFKILDLPSICGQGSLYTLQFVNKKSFISRSFQEVLTVAIDSPCHAV